MRGSLKENRDYLKYLHRRTGVGADQGQLEEELRLRTGIGLGPVSLCISPVAKTSSLTALPELCGLCLRSFWWVRGRVREQDIMNVMVIFDMSIGVLCSRVKIVSEVLKCVKPFAPSVKVPRLLSCCSFGWHPPFYTVPISSLFVFLLIVTCLSHCCLRASFCQPYTLDFVNIWDYHTSDIKLWAWRPDNHTY